MMDFKFNSNSVNDTILLGKHLGKLLQTGDIIGLAGELGSGKTYFTKGIALGLGISSNIVTSPSFTLVNEYEGRLKLFHIDAYRLKDVSDFFSAGLDEYFFKDGVTVMEWADRWPEVLPDNTIMVSFKIINEKKREIIISGLHEHERVVQLIKYLHDIMK